MKTILYFLKITILTILSDATVLLCLGLSVIYAWSSVGFVSALGYLLAMLWVIAFKIEWRTPMAFTVIYDKEIEMAVVAPCEGYELTASPGENKVFINRIATPFFGFKFEDKETER